MLIQSEQNLALVDIANRLGAMIDELAETLGEDGVVSNRAWHMLNVAWEDIVLTLKGQCMTPEEQTEFIHCPM